MSLMANLSCTYGDQKFNATKGFHLNMKRGISHSFKNTGNTEGRLLIMFMPAGCEKLYEELGTPVVNIESFTQPFTFPNFVKLNPTAAKIWD